MDYETLDKIADSYIPTLAIVSMFVMLAVSSGSHNRVKIVLVRAILITILLGIAYGFMFLDNAYNVWPKMSLDYSTHTAVSLALVSFLSIVSPKLLPLWITSLLLYIGLMLFQGYHSLGDIASTALVFSIAILFMFIPIFISRKANKLLHSEKLLAALPIFR